MLDTPQIVETEAQHTAMIRLTVPRSEIQSVMGAAHRDLATVLREQGLKPTGPWFTHHLRRPSDVFDFEICQPVAQPIVASGRVVPGELRAATVARAVYHGPYEGLGQAWGELLAWVEKEGRTGAEDLWERYLAGPETNPDSSTWRTELNRPLLD